jgi:hypothetical protein
MMGQDAALNSKLLRFRGVALAALGRPGAEEMLERAAAMADQAGAHYELALARFELFRVPDRVLADADRATAMEGFSALGISDPSVLVPRVPYDRHSVERPAEASRTS